MKLEQSRYGAIDGQEISKYLICNDNGIEISIINYGATLISVKTPDRLGKSGEIILGYDDLAGFQQGKSYFGCIVGRFANRIGKGQFMLEGTKINVTCNEGNNHLHGGAKGFDKVIWNAAASQSESEASVELNYTSQDSEEGYPGTLTAKVIYTLNNANELIMSYSAQTDKVTIVNLSNHAYWNLAGAGSRNIHKHEMTILADQYLEVDNESIPTGNILPVADTEYDFRQVKPIGRDIEKNGLGYDHCFVLNKKPGELALAVEVEEPDSGRKMQVFTTQPGVQFYSGNYLNNDIGRNGEIYVKNGAFCLETESYPDAPNHDNFPAAVIKPGEVYKETAKHVFSVI